MYLYKLDRRWKSSNSSPPLSFSDGQALLTWKWLAVQQIAFVAHQWFPREHNWDRTNSFTKKAASPEDLWAPTFNQQLAETTLILFWFLRSRSVTSPRALEAWSEREKVVKKRIFRVDREVNQIQTLPALILLGCVFLTSVPSAW